MYDARDWFHHSYGLTNTEVKLIQEIFWLSIVTETVLSKTGWMYTTETGAILLFPCDGNLLEMALSVIDFEVDHQVST